MNKISLKVSPLEKGHDEGSWEKRNLTGIPIEIANIYLSLFPCLGLYPNKLNVHFQSTS